MSALFSPMMIKGVKFRNRIVMPPMVRSISSMPREVVETRGRITEAVLEHYRRRARAGTGMIIVEATAVAVEGRVWEHGLNAFSDEHIPGLARLASCIHSEGAVASIQLVYNGARVGPSAVPPPDGASVPRVLTVEEIQTIEQQFEDAAARAIEARFDAVELHGAHGFLLDAFLSERRNRRRDAYGGTLVGRIRLMVETCRRVKSRIGAEALLDCRISIFNHLDEGFSPSDLAQLVQGLEQAGIDILHVSTDGAFKGYFGTEKTIGQWVRDSTTLPVIVAGGLGNPKDAERLIAEGHANFAAVGSAMLKDADWSRHAREMF